MGGVVEIGIGIDGLSVDARLEMQVRRRGTSRLSGQCNDLSSLHLFTGLHQILAVVAVVGLQAVVVANAHQISIARIGTGEDDLAVEGCPYLVVGLGLQVYTCVASSTALAIGTDDLGVG